MKNGNWEWLDEKIESLKSFKGSLMGYISSSRNVDKPASQMGPDSFQVLRLDSNENFFISNHDLTSILEEVVKNIDLRLYNPEGIAELREALGRYAGVSWECVTVSSGSEQLIDLIARLFLEEGDEVISIVPSFFVYRKRVELEGAKCVEVPLDEDLSLDVDAVLQSVTPRTRIVFICSPNNPTGNQFGWNEIKTIAEESPAIIALDEAYAEFGDFSVAPFAVKERNVIVVRTLSKAFGLAGMRFGYSVSSPELASVLSEIIPYTISSVVSKFVLRLLNHVDLVKKSIEMAKTERRRLIDNLRAIKGIEVLDSKANFVTFRPREKVDFIYEELLKRGILVKNLGDLPVIGHCLRVTVGLPDMNDRFLDALNQIRVN